MIRAYILYKKSEKEAYEYFDKNIRSLPKNSENNIDVYSSELHNTDADAFRHAYVSGVLTQVFGEHQANFYGRVQEFQGNLWGQPKSEELMDLWNNKVGRQYGKRTNSREKLAELLKNALISGELVTTPEDTPEEIETIDAPIDPNKPVVVLQESESGRNEM